jgi:NAD(P)-dependent dehydrogenase (short-subunit alcohol dehydrogenase family)
MATAIKVIITGAASGIGLATARRFLDGGAMVHICDLNENALAEAKAAHPQLHVGQCDISDPQSVAAYFKTAVTELGGIDVLVNNAGISGPTMLIEDISDQDWAKTFAININGPFYAIRAVTPHMKAQKSGAIINISTTSARTGMAKRLAYVTSKSALTGLTKNVARELGPYSIRCNMILPGTIDNARGRALTQAYADQEGLSYADALAEELRYVSMRSMIDMTEIGEAAWFLGGDAARHISGQEIGVCGNVEWEA